MNRSCRERVLIRPMDLHPDCIELGVNIFGYIAPVLTLFVTAINTLIIIIFLKPHVRSHTTFILTLIACADILGISCPTLVFAYLYLFGHYKEFLTCKQIEWTYILGEICVDLFNMFSLWLTVLLAFIRCKCIKSPFKVRHVHSLRRILLYILCICILVILVHLPSLFLFEFQSVAIIDPNFNETKIVCALLEPDGMLLKSCSGRKVQLVMETVLDSILPCVMLVYLNFAMMFALRKAKQNRTSLRRNDSYFKEHKIDSDSSVTRGDKGPSEGLNYTAEVDKTENGIHFMGINSNSEKDDIINGFEKFKTLKSDSEENPDSVFLHSEGKKNRKSPAMKFPCINTCFNCTRSSKKSVRVSTSSYSSLDKLDKESKRTTWLIFCVATVILVHEIPLTALNTYNLTTHINEPLPLSSGCFSIIILFWQFVTYPVIFLIYACMSRTFRLELRKMFSCASKHNVPRIPNGRKPFPCPCSVRKDLRLAKDTRTGHSRGSLFECRDDLNEENL